MVAISRDKVKIWIAPVDTNASTLLLSGTSNLAPILGEIKSYAKSGGDKDVESDPVFGGFVDKEKPRNQVEVTFEVVPSLDDADRWTSIAYSEDSSNSGIYTMKEDPSLKAVFIQATDGSSYDSFAFNNCNVTMFDIDHSADDNRTGSLTLKFSPTDDNNISNFMEGAVAVTSLPAWTSLDNS